MPNNSEEMKSAETKTLTPPPPPPNAAQPNENLFDDYYEIA